MNRTLPVLAAWLALLAGAARAGEPPQAPDVSDTSFATADGARTLQQSIVIDAPVAMLWKAFTDPAEFKRWNAPVAAIDLRVGGSIEASYNPKSPLGDPDNIRHRIITFLPERLVVFQTIQTPRQFPDPALFEKTVSVVQYEPLGPGRTRVTMSVTGWAPGAASDSLCGFFRAGDASLLEKMKAVYEAR
jgi:uncharacterized protein YndB with AHSA1/START domain